MEGVLEMQDLGAALAMAGRDIFSDLPIHRRLERVLDREGAAFDEEITLERRQPTHPGKGFDKLGVARRVNIRVRDLDRRGAGQFLLHCRLLEMRMIVADRHRTEEAVEIDQARIGRSIVQIGAAAFLVIEHNAKAIEQNMLLEGLQGARRDGLAAGGS